MARRGAPLVLRRSSRVGSSSPVLRCRAGCGGLGRAPHRRPRRARAHAGPSSVRRRARASWSAPIADSDARCAPARRGRAPARRPTPASPSSVGGRVVYAAQPRRAARSRRRTEKLVTAARALDELGPTARADTRVAGRSAPPTAGSSTATSTSSAGATRCSRPSAYARHFRRPTADHAHVARGSRRRVVAAGVHRDPGAAWSATSRATTPATAARPWPATLRRRRARPVRSSALTVNDGFDAVPADRRRTGRRPRAAAADRRRTQRRTDRRCCLQARGVDRRRRRRPAATLRRRQRGRHDRLAADARRSSTEMLTRERQPDRRAAHQGARAAQGRRRRPPPPASRRSRSTMGDRGLPLDGRHEVPTAPGSTQADRVTLPAADAALLDQGGPDGRARRGLPVAGQTGTLAERFLGSPVAGRLRAKTGTLNTRDRAGRLRRRAQGGRHSRSPTSINGVP